MAFSSILKGGVKLSNQDSLGAYNVSKKGSQTLRLVMDKKKLTCLETKSSLKEREPDTINIIYQLLCY